MVNYFLFSIQALPCYSKIETGISEADATAEMTQ